MTMVRKKKVYYIRSTSIINDSRASKEILSLINNGFEVTVLGWDRDCRISDYDNIYINNYKINAMFFKYKAKYGKSINTVKGLFLFQLWLYKKLKNDCNKYDYIHACDFDCGYMAYKAAKKYQKKLIYDMYDYYADSRPMPSILKRKVAKIENKIVDFSDISIICGEWRKKQILGTSPKKLLIIHNTPDLKKISKQKIIKSSSDKIKVGYVGILQDHRLIKELIDEFKRNQDYELHIGGFGILENDIKNSLDECRNIYFYGSLNYSQVLSLELDCDILFATYDPLIENHKFSAPNKVYEAMALGKPVIVCKGTGIDELVVNNKIGFAINYSAKEFFKILKIYKQNKELLLSTSKKTKKLYDKRYNWKCMEDQLIGAYKSL